MKQKKHKMQPKPKPKPEVLGPVDVETLRQRGLTPPAAWEAQQAAWEAQHPPDNSDVVQFELQITRQERMMQATRDLVAARDFLAAECAAAPASVAKEAATCAMYRAQNTAALIELEIAEETLAVMKQQLAAVKVQRGIAQ